MPKRKKPTNDILAGAKAALAQANANQILFQSNRGKTHLSFSATIAFILALLAPYLAIIIGLAWILGCFKITVKKSVSKKK